jgi:hypothetical protein
MLLNGSMSGEFLAENPETFLKLKVCSEKWFGNSVGAPVEAETSLDVIGNSGRAGWHRVASGLNWCISIAEIQ